MRNFTFRLDPVIRLKEYQISQKEEEIAEIDREIQARLRAIDEGRAQVQAMRNRLLEEIDDRDLVRAEQSIDLFRQYMAQVEIQKRKEIGEFEETKRKKREELVKLHQEEKMLERHKEKKKIDWDKENQRLERYQMDEIGMQNFRRKASQRGGVLMYLLVPLVLVGAVAAAGWYTGAISEEMLQKIPVIGSRFKSASDTIQIQSATEEDFTYTFNDLIGEEPTTTMKKALQNLASDRDKLRELERRLRTREQELNAREQLVQQQESQLSGLVQFASDQITVIRDLERQYEERQQTERSEREVTLADALSKMSSKSAAPILTELYKQPAVFATPEEEKEAREKQKIVLRLLHRYQQKGLQELFTAIGKADPVNGAQIVADYYSTQSEDLYNFTPRTLTDIMKDVEQKTTAQANAASPSGDPNSALPAPQEMNLNNP